MTYVIAAYVFTGVVLGLVAIHSFISWRKIK
jgi:hypothetical protein